MFQYRDFTNDPNTFPYAAGQELMSRLHAAGQHYVPIVDSALYIPNPNNASDNYSIYTDGNDRGVFLNNPDGSQYIGNVWPGYTVFPDWHAEQAVPWWTDSMKEHHDKISWDGIWIGGDSKWKAEFTNDRSNEDMMLSCWQAKGFSGMSLNVNNPDILVKVPAGKSIELSFKEKMPSACAPFYASTALAQFDDR